MTEKPHSPNDDHTALPTKQALVEAGALEIYNERGEKVTFQSLYTNTDDSTPLVIIVLIRHFFCGACELYIQDLTAKLTTSPPSRAQIRIIGCGQASLIPAYRARNNIPPDVAMFANPDLRVYKALGMRATSSPFMEGMRAEKKDYHQGKGFWGIVGSSMWNAVGSGMGMFRSGPPGQNGGVVVVNGKGEEGEVVWCWRMRSTSDYADVGEVQKVISERA